MQYGPLESIITYKGSLLESIITYKGRKCSQLFIIYFTQVYTKAKESEHSSSTSENQNIDWKEKVECIYKYSKLTKMMGKKNILHESVS